MHELDISLDLKYKHLHNHPYYNSWMKLSYLQRLEWNSLSVDLLPHPDMFTDERLMSPNGDSKRDKDGAKRLFFGGERFLDSISGAANVMSLLSLYTWFAAIIHSISEPKGLPFDSSMRPRYPFFVRTSGKSTMSCSSSSGPVLMVFRGFECADNNEEIWAEQESWVGGSATYTRYPLSSIKWAWYVIHGL